jgi:hypothetical protein
VLPCVNNQHKAHPVESEAQPTAMTHLQPTIAAAATTGTNLAAIASRVAAATKNNAIVKS